MERYLIKEEGLNGGMSSVAVGEDKSDGKRVIIKRVENNEKSIRYISLLNEIKILSELCHPAVPKIYDVIYDKKMLTVIMEYKEGKGLDVFLREKHCISEEFVRQVLIELCDILGYIHGQKIPVIHRDIKPENIITGRRVALIDYGAARFYMKDSKNDTICLGTMGYAAPEQYGGLSQSDERTDIYGLGMTLKAMLEKMAKRNRRFEEIADKCTNQNPDRRYRNSGELLAALLNIRRNGFKPPEAVSITMIHTDIII